MMSASRIDHRLITPYHPSANGVAERTVQTATRLIKKLLKGIKHNRDDLVQFVQYCINQKITERHQHRPFEVVFGRQANAFADYTDTVIPLSYMPSASEHEQIISYIQQRIETMQFQLFPDIANRGIQSGGIEARKFNKSHRITDIPIGSYVMVRDNTRKSKLEPANEGPFKIVSKTRRGAYALEDLSGRLISRNFPPSAIISLSTHPTFAQESYEVNTILDHEETPNGYNYLVQWTNKAEEDSWESEENFDDHGVITNIGHVAD
jgi:hypothetical protein